MQLSAIDGLIAKIEHKLEKSLSRFESTLSRLPGLKGAVDEYTDRELGTYDEMMSRFARLTDIFLSQYLRALIKKSDPAFQGSLRDSLDLAEKYGFIDSAEEWYHIRELRNRQAHEYEEDDLIGLFKDILDQVPRIKSVISARTGK
ncbi:MAG: hypothetical protein A2583_14660 [Bdellovibrionales bacterium RIFOXYD1_FULL_53_11]|nr:MAG: hypothetical protein A2583_14660 [Bdellovibrionales bacterium RIFOXYD1_FULL_53_11]